MAGPGDDLRSSWPPPATRPCLERLVGGVQRHPVLEAPGAVADAAPLLPVAAAREALLLPAAAATSASCGVTQNGSGLGWIGINRIHFFVIL
jgi:hypothetical protein